MTRGPNPGRRDRAEPLARPTRAPVHGRDRGWVGRSRHVALNRRSGRLRCWRAGIAIAGSAFVAPATAPVAAAATVVQTWQTRIGASGAWNDTATLQALDTGKGVLRIRATKLRAGSSYTVTVYRGRCGWMATRLFTLPSVTTTSSGARHADPRDLSAAQLRTIRSNWNAGNGVAIQLARGSSKRCGGFGAYATRRLGRPPRGRADPHGRDAREAWRWRAACGSRRRDRATSRSTSGSRRGPAPATTRWTTRSSTAPARSGAGSSSATASRASARGACPRARPSRAG